MAALIIAGPPAEAATAALAAFSALDIERQPTMLNGVFKLAAQWGLTAYDAAYLRLAVELKAPRATFDARLGAAAKAHPGNIRNKP